SRARLSSTTIRTILLPLLAPCPPIGSSDCAVSPIAITCRPDGSVPTTWRTSGVNSPTSQAFSSQTSACRNTSSSHGMYSRISCCIRPSTSSPVLHSLKRSNGPPFFASNSIPQHHCLPLEYHGTQNASPYGAKKLNFTGRNHGAYGSSIGVFVTFTIARNRCGSAYTERVSSRGKSC